MDLIKSGSYIDIFYAKTCATTKISTVAGYHIVLAMLLLDQRFGDSSSESTIHPSNSPTDIRQHHWTIKYRSL